jgi:DNA-binding NtrC family response regulator
MHPKGKIPMGQILLIGNDNQLFNTIEHAAQHDHQVTHCEDVSLIKNVLRTKEYDLVFFDVPDNRDTPQILSSIQFHSPHSTLVLINTQEQHNFPFKQYNIFNILDKPVTLKKIQLTIERVFENKHYKNELDFLRGQQDSVYNFDSIIAYSPSIKKVMAALKKFAQTDSTILITGETGTGKSFLSSSIHYNSLRKSKPFVTINCANLPESILDSELFGHEKGAFTGAEKTRIGRLEQAHLGTVFLDEIAELDYSLQAKLLRVLEEKKIERVGGNKTIECNVRIISATNKIPEKQVEQGNLREDLYYRLNVLRAHIPPLRERAECIQPLADFLLFKNARKIKKHVKGFTQGALDMFQNYPWPGNIRQLQNTIERALILEESEWIGLENLNLVEPCFSRQKECLAPHFSSSARSDSISLINHEKQRILQALENNDWIQKEASKELGITPRALNYKIKKHGITHKRWLKNKE